MCASCVAQGVVYAGGALAGLQVMAARARRRRGQGASGGARTSTATTVAGEPLIAEPDGSAPPACAVPSGSSER
jgi:hypothetical protein